jgi:hypothetical protein
LILGLVVSTIAYFVAAYYIKRYLEEMGIPKGMTRTISVFVLALAIAYGVAWIVGLIAGT